MLFLTLLRSLSTLGSLGMCKEKNTHCLYSLYCARCFVHQVQAGECLCQSKKDTVMFGSPHYIVKTSYR